MRPQCLERRVDSSLIPGFLARVPRSVVVLLIQTEGSFREREAWV